MRDNGFIVWIVLGAALVVVLNLPSSFSRQLKAALREGVAPLQSVVTGFARNVGETVRMVRGIGGLVSENEKMAAELTRLRNEGRELKTLEKENRELRAHLRFRQQAPRRLIACNVIARDISGWWQTIRLSKGSAEGIAPNMAVVTVEGLVGKTIDVSLRTSDVLLISDPSCRVSAQLSRTESYGLVSGRGPSWRGQALCRMEFINKNIPVRPGDEVVTSGLGGVLPKGLLIGYVEQVTMDTSGLYQRADILPRADLGRVVYAFVVSEEMDPVEEWHRTQDLSGGGSS